VTKYLLRKLCAKWLPASVLTKKKQGFAIPKDRWFRKELRGAAEEILLDKKTLSRGYFSEKTTRAFLQDHLKGKRDYSNWIWCLIVLEMWFRTFIDEQRVTQDQ
jgi:asparagine synthase (glutamine-hydrolysing)